MMAWAPEEGNYFEMLQSKIFQGCLAVGMLICWRVGGPRLGQGQLCHVPQDEVMSPSLVPQLPQAVPQAGGRGAGKGLVGKDLKVLADSGWMNMSHCVPR